MYWPVDNVIWAWNFVFECPTNHIYMSHTAHVIFAVKRDLGFFPSPLLNWKQLKKVDWVSRSPGLGVRCCLKGSRCLSIRSQVVRCLAQLLVQHMGTDRSVSVLALNVWTSSHLGGACCKLSFLLFINRSCALDSNINVPIRVKLFFCIFLEGIKDLLV